MCLAVNQIIQAKIYQNNKEKLAHFVCKIYYLVTCPQMTLQAQSAVEKQMRIWFKYFIELKSVSFLFYLLFLFFGSLLNSPNIRQLFYKKRQSRLPSCKFQLSPLKRYMTSVYKSLGMNQMTVTEDGWS